MRKALYFLGVLDDRDVDWMIRHGRKITLAPGAQLIEQGKHTEWLYFVLDGALVVHTPAVSRVAVLKAGEVVGEISFVDERPPVASVRAEVESKVGAIPRAALAGKLRQDVGFAAPETRVAVEPARRLLLELWAGPGRVGDELVAVYARWNELDSRDQ